jgi:predicted MFS family arabinose efflux permease
MNMALPTLLSKHSPQKILACLLGGACVALIYQSIFNDTPSLFVTFFIFSVLGATGQTVSIVLINYSLNNQIRSSFMGFYNTLYNLAIALGPFLSATFTPKYYLELNFFFILILLFFALLSYFDKNFIELKEKDIEKKTFKTPRVLSVIDIFRNNPLFFILSFTTCLNMVTIIHLLVFWGETYSLNTESSKILQSIFSLGGACLAIPLSYLANKTDIIKIYAFCLLLLVVCFAVLSFNKIFSIYDYIALFIIGGCITATFSMTMSFIGQYMRAQLSKATAGLSFMRISLSILSTYLAGEIIDTLGATSLNFIMSIINALMLILLLKAANKKILLNKSDRKKKTQQTIF